MATRYPRECRIGSLVLSPPVTNASGFLATPPEYRRFSAYRGVGGVVGKTIVRLAKPGHETPVVVVKEDGSVLNAIGLAGPGVDEHAREMADFYPLHVPFIESVASEESADDAALVIRRLNGRYAAIELNISCPNVMKGMLAGQDPNLTSAYTAAAKNAARIKSVIVKLTPNVDDITEPGRAAADAGADALLVANTEKDTYINPHTNKPHLTNKTGGKSGRNIMENNLRRVEAIARMREAGGFKFKIGGVGGIAGAEDARKYFDAGADYIQVGTEFFLDRPLEIKRLTQPGLETVQEMLERMEAELYGRAA